MKYRIITFLSLLVTLGFLLSCAQTPQQIAEKTLDPTTDIATQKAKDSTVRLVSRVGKSKTLGSGFFVDTDKIATTIHVVAQPGPIFVKLSGKERTLAVKGIAAFDVKNNLVILKLSGEGTPLPLGNSDAVQTNESVSVVGYPYRQYEAAVGAIDSIQKSDKWFRMKIATPRGTSGGPMLNSKGQVIGINVGYGDDTHSYAIPSGALKELLSQSESLELLKEWRKRNHVRAEVHHSQGVAKFAAEGHKNAIVDFDKAIELNPEHVRAYYKRGKAKYHINDYVGAIDDCTHAIKLNPEHARAYNGRGVAKIKLGDSKLDDGDEEKARYLYQEAIDDGTQAITIDPKDAGFYSNRGVAKFKLGESKSDGRDAKKARHLYQEAIADLTQAIKIDPDNARAYNNRSVVRCKLGDTESAHGDAKKARRLYYEGIADYDKSIQLKYPEDDALIARIESEKGRASTVRVTCWSGVSNKISSGSGFFVDTDKIATNIHVIDGPGPVFAKLMDKETIWEVVGVIAFDVEYDLIVLKLSGEGTPLPLGNSDVVQRGEPVVAVGYPGGKYKVTTGNVHGIRNSDKLLGTTAEISNGNSGGPLLNDKGKVIGINTRSEKYSFAVPSNILKELLTRPVSPEPLTQWQKQDLIRAYAHHGEGENRFDAGDYAKAIINFDNAILHNPKYIRAYNWRGRAKFHLAKSKVDQGKLAEAMSLYQVTIDDFTQAIKINPEFTQAYNNRGLTQYQLGESKAGQGDVTDAQHFFQAAINDYTRSIKIDSKYTFPYFNRALTRHNLGQSNADQGNVTEAQRLYQAAIDDYTHAIQLEPEYAYAFNNRGSTKYDLGKSKEEQGGVAEAQQLYQAAIDDYTRAINIDPEYVRAYNNRGVAREALGQDEAAEEDFQKAKELEAEK